MDLAETTIEGLVWTIRQNTRTPGSDAPLDPVADWESITGAFRAADLLVSQATALRAAALLALREEIPPQYGSDAVIEEVMAALRVSKRSAVFLRNDAESLRCHPEVWEALVRGGLDVAKARVTMDALFSVPTADADGVLRDSFEADYGDLLRAALHYAPEHTSGQLRRHLQKLLAELDPGVLARRRRRALCERGVWLTDRGDGTADLSATLASEDAAAIYAAVRRHAMTSARECSDASVPESAGYSFDESLADAYVDLFLSGGSGSTAGATPSARVTTTIHVTIPVESLAAITDEPGTLSGFGVLPADVVRRLAAGDSRWRQVLTHRGTGALLEAGSYTYRPSTALSRHVRLRDGTCRFPGCAVSAQECDLDHLIAFPRGSTTPDNLHSLCRRHHRMKHEGGWLVEATDDHGLRWTSPLGVVATSSPRPHDPGSRPAA